MAVKWEYKILDQGIFSNLEKEMNKLGADGWELVVRFNPSNKLNDKDKFIFKKASQ